MIESHSALKIQRNTNLTLYQRASIGFGEVCEFCLEFFFLFIYVLSDSSKMNVYCIEITRNRTNAIKEGHQHLYLCGSFVIYIKL